MNKMDVAAADVGYRMQHSAAAEQLDFEAFTLSAMRQDRVDHVFHGVVAVAGRGAETCALAIPAAVSCGSIKWFMPPTPIFGSRIQAEMHEPSTVLISSLDDDT